MIRRLALGLAAGLLLACGLAAPAAAIDIQRVTSPLGIEAWLVESHAVPVISISFGFRGGIETDPPGKEGRATLVSYTLDEGAGDLDSATFQGRRADLGVDLYFTASTDAFLGSLKTVTANSAEAFDLMALALTEARFDPAPVERMRAAMAAEIRQRTADPGWMSRRTYFSTLFPDHPYGRPSYGTMTTLAGLAVDDLRQFVAERFARDQLLIGVAGDITPAQLGAALDRIFGGLPAAGVPVAVPSPPSVPASSVLVERPGPQSVLLMGQPGIDQTDPDYYAALVMNYILGGGGFESRLTEEVRARRGLTYGISSYFIDWSGADLLNVSSDLSNAGVAETIRLVRQEWAHMAEGGVSAEEVADAKTYLIGSFALSLTSTDAISDTLLALQIRGLGIDHLETRTRKIEAVTPADVDRVAARLLDPAALTTVVVGDPGPDYHPDRTIRAADLAAAELAVE